MDEATVRVFESVFKLDDTVMLCVYLTAIAAVQVH